MALILKNKYYLYDFNELIGGTMWNRGWVGITCPDIQLMSEDDFWKFFIDINGTKERFYIKKGVLKKSELQAMYVEIFYNFRLNGHCYIRPEMRIHHGDVVVDSGGCEGYYARYALNMGASKVIIFEPCPELAEGLRRTFEEEIAVEKVLVIEKALGRKKCNDILYVDRNMFCSSSIATENKHALKREVAVISLDEALRDIGISHIDVYKMDIEGAEVEAVMGARKTIKACRPKMIIATYHSYYNAIRIRNICMRIDDKYKCRVYGCYQVKRPFRPYITFLR